MDKESLITVSISIPSKLLAQVKQMKGKSRNEKLLKCVRIGYQILRK
jgi:hypothetical protein